MVRDCSGFIEPGNLECLLVNTFAGTMDIFVFVSLIAIAVIGASFRMINTTMLIIFALFAIIMAQYMSGIYFLVVLIIGLFVSFAVGRLVKA